jgi:signal transduction histidine kinase/DNA-binding response OmpR family regulator
MLKKLLRCFSIAVLLALPFSNNAAAQVESMVYLSLADTNSSGNILLHQIEGWAFSFSNPDTIADRKNLKNAIPGSVYDIRELKSHPQWNEYGWFEIVFYVDSTLAGIPWVLTYGNPEPARIWLNGKLVLEAGNPAQNPENERLSLFYNSMYQGLTLREGENYLLVEYSEHTFPEVFKPYRQAEHGIWIPLYGENGPQLRRYRAFIFGGTCMLLLLLLCMHSYLAFKFRDQYHKYVSLTTLFMLFHAVTTMSDSLFNWSYSFVYFYQYSYAVSFIFVVYFFLISIRQIFKLNIAWRLLTGVLIFSVLSATISVTAYPGYLNILHPLLVILTLLYGAYSLIEARKVEINNRVGIIAAGLIITIGGALLYVLFYVALGYPSIWLFLIAVLMAYVGIPISLTFNVASNYANLISTLEEKVRNRTADLEAASEFQNRFFANISHEFRTPLTISEGLLNKTINNEKELSSTQRMDFMVMKRNMRRLHDMVDQIIDLTKADKDHLALNQKYYLADNLVAVSVESFRSLAEYHGHSFTFYPDAEQTVLFVDRAKVEVMINNLISNAIKFTPDGGAISIVTRVKENSFYVAVQDSGKGIPESEQESIFERFHRIKRVDDDYVEGMGVGLELSRTLARLHGGDLSLDTSYSNGARFELILPIAEESNSQLVNLDDSSQSDELYVSKMDQELDKHKDFDILLVEDNKDMIDYLTDILSEAGSIKQARDGREALDVLSAKTPDIIITDLMMPVMGGVELVEELMKHPKWKEIPVIVLTAKALEEEKTNILRYGVVDYITKPFVPDHLLLKIKNLLIYYTRRKSIRLKMKAEPEAELNQFSEKVADFIITNIENYNLTVDILANEFAQSRRSFYRNIQSETGMTPAEFIREVRLTTARNMVSSNKNLRLEELATSVGYKSATSFRKIYEERFGEHPLD